MKILLTVCLFLTTSFQLFADPTLINHYLRMVAEGKVEEVKSKLPDLLVESPNDPGVQLLLGVVIEDAFKSIEIYTKITNNYPESEWADDAKWRIVQFYSVLGDTSKAMMELADFKKKYPSSPYLSPASDVVRSSVSLAKSKRKVTTDMAMNSQSNTTTKTKKKDEAPEILPDPSVTPPKKVEVKKVEPPTPEPEKQAPVNNSMNNSSMMAKPVDNMPVKNDPPVMTPNTSNKNIEETPMEVDKTPYFGLQVGIYQSKEAAELEKQKYFKQRMRTEVIQKTIDGKEMYSVVIGNYSSKATAEAAKIIVKQQCSCDPIIYDK